MGEGRRWGRHERWDDTGRRLAALVLGVLVGSSALFGAWVAVPGPAAAADASWRGEYFAGTTLSGTPAFVRQDAAINFD